MGILSALFGVQSPKSENIKILAPAEFNAAITQKNVQLVDVRTPREFSGGAIRNAINIDVFQKNLFHEKANKLDKQKPVYLYCRSGNRSQQAARMLVSAGFEQVFDLRGGYMNWPY